MNQIDVADLDFIYLTYDEPHAEENWVKIKNMVPWARRVDGVKGSDAAHKAAGAASDTDRFILIDGDNMPDESFFNLQLDFTDKDPKYKIAQYRWKAINNINGLRYGNGGLKIWKKGFVLNMKTHEAAESDRAQVDFCWEDGYRNFPMSFSDSIITGSPFQAWRAGFREGVKMTLLDGVKVPAQEIQKRIWWHNLHRLKMWATVGSHEENGLYAIYGARLGTWMTNCTQWDYVEVRDFEILRGIWNQYGKPYEEVNGDGLVEEIKSLGEKIKLNLGFNWPYLDPATSKYTLDLYGETVELCKTYFRMPEHV
jgi:hypothetical protein